MIKLSTKERYGLRALIYLANHPNEIISLNTIANNQNISLDYLESIFAVLKTNDFVVSHKGIYGGYSLNKPSNQYTVYDIIQPINETLFNTNQAPKDLLQSIIFNEVYYKIDDTIKKYLKSITLEDIAKEKLEDFSLFNQ